MKEAVQNALFKHAWESASSDARPQLAGQASYRANCERIKSIRLGLKPLASEDEVREFIEEVQRAVEAVVKPQRTDSEVMWVSATRVTPGQRLFYVQKQSCDMYDALCHLYLAAPNTVQPLLEINNG